MEVLTSHYFWLKQQRKGNYEEILVAASTASLLQRRACVPPPSNAARKHFSVWRRALLLAVLALLALLALGVVLAQRVVLAVLGEIAFFSARQRNLGGFQHRSAPATPIIRTRGIEGCLSG